MLTLYNSTALTTILSSLSMCYSGGDIPHTKPFYMYDVDLYTYNGSMVHIECQSLEDVFDVIKRMIADVELINIQMT